MTKPNPNNCATCDHKQNPDGGWCYMFRDEPTKVCMIHSRRDLIHSTEVQALMSHLVPKRK